MMFAAERQVELPPPVVADTSAPVGKNGRIWAALRTPVKVVAAAVATILVALAWRRSDPLTERAFFYDIIFLALIALPFQALFPAVRRKPKVLTREYVFDVLYALQLLFLPLAFLHGWFQRIGSNPFFPALARLPFWSQVLLTVVVHDFVVYWRHRLEHTFKPLWSFHAIHHTSEQIDVLTASRVHPFELILGMTLVNLVSARIGVDPLAFDLGFAIFLKYNDFIHFNVKLRFPGPLKYIFVSPFMHQWHHAVEEEAWGKNVGVVFAWNDWLLGTAYHPKEFPTKFGLTVPDADQVPESYWRQLLYPAQYAWVRLRSRRAAAQPNP